MAEIYGDLTRRQINQAHKELASLFTEEREKRISLNVNALKRQLTKVKNIPLIQPQDTKGTGAISYELAENKQTKNRRRLLLQGYEIIQQVRAYLTGDRLTYMYYSSVINQNNQFQVNNVVSFTDKDLFNIATFSKTGINISLTKKAIEDLTKLDDAEVAARQRFSKAFEKIVNTDMEFAGETKLLKVHKYIYSAYRGVNAGLENLKYFKKTGKTLYQAFNQGHLNEAYEATMQALLAEYSNNVTAIKDYMIFDRFFRLLKLDSKKGFKGGDVGLMQVKANQARLMRYNTIKNTCDELLQALDLLKEDKEKGKKKLEQMFLAEESKENAAVGKIIDQSIEDLFNSLQKQV